MSIDPIEEKLELYRAAAPRPGFKDDIIEAALRRKTPFWRNLMQNRVAQFSTAATVIVAVAISILLFRPSPAWSQVLRALQDVQYVHLTVKETKPGQSEARVKEAWGERPSRLRKDGNKFVMVDDGVNRLVLNTARKTAQLSDSELASNPCKLDDLFKSVAFFQHDSADDAGISVKLIPLSDENAPGVLAYALEITPGTGEKPVEQRRVLTGKLWIGAETKLPLRLQGEVRSGEARGLVSSVQAVFNYEPIPAEVFSTAVPAGYSELPRKTQGALCGKVVDEQGKPVAGAHVYATATYDIALQGVANAQGDFELKLKPKNGMHVFFPIFVAAYQTDVPDRVAWTIIRDPRRSGENDAFDRMCPIPGNPGTCEVSTEGTGGPCAGATGIVLKMEPAARVYGTLTNERGNPVSGAEITAYPMCSFVGSQGTVHLDGNGIRPRSAASTDTALAVTDSNGKYELTNLPRFWDGTQFYLTANAKDFVKKSASFTMDGRAAATEMNLQIYHADGTITGRVTNDHGDPLIGYRVCPVIGNVEYRTVKAFTDSDGRYKLVGCPVAPGVKVRLLSDNAIDMAPNWPKGRQFIYYPPCEAGIKYRRGQKRFEVNLLAVTPDIALTVTLKDSQGRPIPNFPVELRTGVFHANDWMEKYGRKRTDSQGVCVFRQVPDVQGMQLYLSAAGKYPIFPFVDPVTEDEKERIKAENEKYHPSMAPVHLVPNQDAQSVEVSLPTWDEWNAQKAGR